MRIAQVARAGGCGNWIKIEVINDNRYLLPDNQETVEATRILATDGFTILPYMSPDLNAARRLAAAGAAAIMPLGAPIGSNRGLRTRELVRILIEEIDIPVIVDAGLPLSLAPRDKIELPPQPLFPRLITLTGMSLSRNQKKSA